MVTKRDDKVTNPRRLHPVVDLYNHDITASAINAMAQIPDTTIGVTSNGSVK